MLRRCLTILLLSALSEQALVADSITYRQLRQETGAAFLYSPAPAVVPETNLKKQQASDPAKQGPRAQESPTHPEFVRLPDGRIVKYGPGVICAEDCVEAVPLGRARVSRTWYSFPPLLAAGILCAVLCRGGEAPGGQPPVIQPSPSPTAPPPTPTPPNEIPEPGTLVLLSLGLGALAARRKLLKKAAE